MLIIAWETTGACNLSCTYCRASARPEPSIDELTTDEALKFLEDVSPLKPLMIFSGGEPLMRPDIFQLLGRASSLGIRASLATNGTLFSPEMVDKVASSGVNRVSISLDGASAEVHDATRGEGTFDRVMEGIKNLEGKLEFQLNMTVTQRNESELLPTMDLAEEVGAKALHLFFMVPTGRGREDCQISAMRHEELLRQISEESQRRSIEIQVVCVPQYARVPHRGRPGGCLAGRSFVFISRSGEVNPCGYMPIKAGNIREKSFTHIWNDSEIFRSLRTNSLKGRCGKCAYSKPCGGCRARAYAQTGEYLDSDPLCALGGL
jgi:AdoMet-dependent heme synthase